MRSAVALSLVGLMGTAGLAHGQDKVLQKAIDRAIVRGVAHLRSLQQADGKWTYPGNFDVGATSLSALALLECGVPKNDPSIQAAARYVRKEIPELIVTYNVSLAIMLLDRLGDPLDIPLIEALGVRLSSPADGAIGGWAYTVNTFGDKEWLERYVVERETGVARPRTKATSPSELPKPIQEMLAKITEPEKLDFANADNSNTQLGSLAMWVARRYGLPVEKTLRLVDLRYRKTQYSNGAWGYVTSDTSPDESPNWIFKPAMTCTGLIGMAAYYGTIKDPDKKPLLDDPAVKKPLQLLARFVGRPNGLKKAIPLPDGDNSYYTLWTLERMAMLYDLKKIGGNDWYAWGAEILIAHQQANGAWEGKHPDGPDTCFALLFLKRSNIAPDLTRILMQGIAKESASPSTPIPNGSEPVVKEIKTDASTLQARTEAVRLSTALLEAPLSERDAILDKIRQGKGTPFNQTLAAAIPQLTGDSQAKARKTLVVRLADLPTAELRKELKSIDTEMRRAAAGACGAQKLKEAVPDLIDLLMDAESGIAGAAHQSLREITSQNFGPAAGASREEREKAIRAWKDWWKAQ